ncbi:MerR family transcriptional regulator [Cnuibacter physcomitrellae]|uniref:MerR family transcriptional regulator n=1 Tax=Cnuibacter physcomitrellae TaxID=1619308 RepID=A0A1X9LIV9_9MICO|nr:MerR family transcriptional regulator [Cnuibacter physcomitrellae]GGI35005.1 MerR family transcriptional regulator [Cnuibacter physcomitrellae]
MPAAARPSTAGRSTSVPSQGPLLGIGQVLAKLSTEFPDVSGSKLRFLEERGLVHPARTQSGYRKFSAADVSRLRLILSLQRDCYLPLAVIKDYLADVDAGLNPPMPGAVLPAGASILPGGRRFSRDELTREAGATPMLVQDAFTANVIVPADSYGEDTLAVLKALVQLQRSGIEPRHLRGFRQAAERELSLIESALMPVAKRRDPQSRAKVAELALEIAGQLEVVRSSLIRAALGRIVP